MGAHLGPIVLSVACRQRQDGKLLPGAQERRSLPIAKQGAPSLGPARMKHEKRKHAQLSPDLRWKQASRAHLQGCARASPPPRPSRPPRRAGRAWASAAPASLRGPPSAPEPGSRRPAARTSRETRKTPKSAGPDLSPGRERRADWEDCVGTEAHGEDRADYRGVRTHGANNGTSGASGAGLRAAKEGGARAGGGALLRDPASPAIPAAPPPSESPPPTCTASRRGSRELACGTRAPLLSPCSRSFLGTPCLDLFLC